MGHIVALIDLLRTLLCEKVKFEYGRLFFKIACHPYMKFDLPTLTVRVSYQT